jgi:outer membrane protein assembly factor BamB
MRIAPPALLRVALISLLLAVPGAVPVAHAGETDGSPVSAEELERLRAIGYVSYSVEKADPQKTGVTTHRRDRAQPGYTLYSTGPLCLAELIDLEGKVVRSWHHEPCGKWSNVELLPDGDILVPCMRPQRFLLRMSWNGAVVWNRARPVHHDMDALPNGDLLVLERSLRLIPEHDRDVPVADNQVTRFSAAGEPMESVSLYDVLAAAEARPMLRVEPRRGQIDLLHTNSVEWVRRPDLTQRHPMFARDLVLVTSRSQDLAFLIDWETRDLVWSWGQGELSGPHDATMLDNGNMMIFDNGFHRGWSRILELDPTRREIVWEYRGTDSDPFFSLSRGSNQRLANGNTLIAQSDSGRMFEVTPQGEIVWEFWSPHLDEDGHRAVIVRAKRYGAEFIESLLHRPSAD